MRILKTRLFATAIFAAAMLLWGAAGLRAEIAEGASLERRDGVYYLHLEGGHYEMGRQHGALMKEQVQQVYEIYLHQKAVAEWVKQYAMLHNSILGMRDPYNYILGKSRQMEEFIPERLLEEMRGLAAGAEVPYEDVLIMSTHVDFLGMIACTGFTAVDSATADGKLYHGRNLDWGHGFGAELDEMVVVMAQKPEGGIPFVSLTYPGLVGVLTAMNAEGLSLELNFSMTNDTSIEGVPVMIRLQDVIQSRSDLQGAVEALLAGPHTAGSNIMVSDARAGAVVEFSGSRSGVVPMVDDVVVTTNHFQAQGLEGTNVATDFGAVNSGTRFDRTNELLAQHRGGVDLEVSKSILHDGQIKVEGTLHSMVFVPHAGEIHFWRRGMGPDFLVIRLGELFGMD